LNHDGELHFNRDVLVIERGGLEAELLNGRDDALIEILVEGLDDLYVLGIPILIHIEVEADQDLVGEQRVEGILGDDEIVSIHELGGYHAGADTGDRGCGGCIVCRTGEGRCGAERREQEAGEKNTAHYFVSNGHK